MLAKTIARPATSIQRDRRPRPDAEAAAAPAVLVGALLAGRRDSDSGAVTFTGVRVLASTLEGQAAVRAALLEIGIVVGLP